MKAPFAAVGKDRKDKESIARKLLGVTDGAKRDDIRKAYRRLARKSHPDHNPQNPLSHSRFINFTNAYSILMEGDDNLGQAQKKCHPGFLAHMTGFMALWRKRVRQ